MERISINYIYDGSIEGLYCCIYEYYYREHEKKYSFENKGILRNIYTKQNAVFDFLIKDIAIETDYRKAEIVQNAIKDKISTKSLYNIYYCYLASKSEMLILQYIILGFKYGNKLDLNHGNETVMGVQKLHKKVSYEAHRFQGYIRFSDVGGVLVSKIKPDNDILVLVSEHFCDRFKNERFVIYDEKRNKGLVSENGKFFIMEDLDRSLYKKLFFDEMGNERKRDDFEYMWKIYFKTIAIKERENPRCQMNFVPKKYRKNLLEFE